MAFSQNSSFADMTILFYTSEIHLHSNHVHMVYNKTMVMTIQQNIPINISGKHLYQNSLSA